MHHPTYRITHTTAFATPVVEHWLEREIVALKRLDYSLMSFYGLTLIDILKERKKD